MATDLITQGSRATSPNTNGAKAPMPTKANALFSASDSHPAKPASVPGNAPMLRSIKK